MPFEGFVLLTLLTSAQVAPATISTGAAAVPTIEVGGMRHQLWSEGSDDLGPWNTVNATVFWQPPLRVRPVIDVERQTRPSGSHSRAGAGLYVDWTKSLYSYQSLSFSRETEDATRFYPRRRADVRLFWKLPRQSPVTLAAGYTTLTFGSPQSTDIYNVGALVYGSRSILQATLYVNRNEPDALVSAAGSVSVQVGREGRGWYGVTASGGRELYRVETGLGAATADFKSATLGAFARKWVSRSAGVHVAAEYQRIIDSYSRLGMTGRVFVGF